MNLKESKMGKHHKIVNRYPAMWIKDFKYRIKMYNKLYKRFFKRGMARNHVKIISWAKWTIKQLWDNPYQKLNKVLMRFQGL